MAERLAQHKHCPSCGLAMGPKRESCSEACGAILAAKIRRQRMTMFVWIAVSVMVIAVFIASMR